MNRRSQQGFTLIELIIVISVIGILAAIAVPNLLQVPRRADEAVLRTNLSTIRQVIDQHYGDKGYYPSSVEGLVDEGYLRNVPLDPITGEPSWGEIYEQDLDPSEVAEAVDLEYSTGIIDVYSLSEELSLDGTPYSEW